MCLAFLCLLSTLRIWKNVQLGVGLHIHERLNWCSWLHEHELTWQSPNKSSMFPWFSISRYSLYSLILLGIPLDPPKRIPFDHHETDEISQDRVCISDAGAKRPKATMLTTSRRHKRRTLQKSLAECGGCGCLMMHEKNMKNCGNTRKMKDCYETLSFGKICCLGGNWETYSSLQHSLETRGEKTCVKFTESEHTSVGYDTFGSHAKIPRPTFPTEKREYGWVLANIWYQTCRVFVGRDNQLHKGILTKLSNACPLRNVASLVGPKLSRWNNDIIHVPGVARGSLGKLVDHQNQGGQKRCQCQKNTKCGNKHFLGHL